MQPQSPTNTVPAHLVQSGGGTWPPDARPEVTVRVVWPSGAVEVLPGLVRGWAPLADGGRGVCCEVRVGGYGWVGWWRVGDVVRVEG